jgi:hypothetical protein
MSPLDWSKARCRLSGDQEITLLMRSGSAGPWKMRPLARSSIRRPAGVSGMARAKHANRDPSGAIATDPTKISRSFWVLHSLFVSEYVLTRMLPWRAPVMRFAVATTRPSAEILGSSDRREARSSSWSDRVSSPLVTNRLNGGYPVNSTAPGSRGSFFVLDSPEATLHESVSTKTITLAVHPVKVFPRSARNETARLLTASGSTQNS